jgi:flagellar biosynthesis protein FlhB
MAGGGDRTERPTRKRRDKARREGRVAKSVEVNSTAVLLATLGVLAATAPRLLAKSEAIMASGLGRAGTTSLSGPGSTSELVSWGLRSFAGAVAPVMLAAAAAGVLASVLQVGFRFTPRALRPSFRKLNPWAGLKRMFSPASLVELAKSLAKTAVIGFVAYRAIAPRLETMGSLVGLPPGALLVTLAHTLFAVALRIGAALGAIAALDFVWQRYRHERSLRMSKAELRKEVKEMDVAPEMRGMMRRRQSELARRRMLADVPGADVVVVNPTHFAVALRYDGSRPAPEVVAKGADLIAAAIRRVAEEAGVTIVHEPPLARALYRDVEIGQTIPEELYAAVAQVLAFVFRTARRRRLAA